ncbi:kallikrein-6-like [Drosophila bipectinata]|uniref:kallikrein-6-like n=1 Tax=Drosophila bipectinata TaxID=42026 RepID=UPI001C89C6DA|nr:kallikrein-6-like [Drosophila bipectinata]
MIIHEKYEPVSKRNNLALLKLSEPLKLSRNIEEAPLAGIVPKVNSLAKVATWRKSIFFYHLSVIEEAIISKDECSKALDNSALQAALATETICAQNKILGACDKDLGAPLISRGQLAGILTNPSCSSKPDVYTSVVQYKTWLEANTE